MPTRFLRGPPHDAWGRRRSAYSEGRHSVPYADVGIGNDVAVIGELLLANAADAVLSRNLAVEKLPHLTVGAQLAITTGVLGIVDAADTHLTLTSFPWDCLSATAGEGAVDRAELVSAESHGDPPSWPEGPLM